MAGKAILIVEDEEAQRNALHRALEWRGFVVESAADAESALNLARKRKKKNTEPYDVVVLDMQLDTNDPRSTTGVQVGSELRKLWPRWAPEFLVRSAYSYEEYYRQALKLGVAAYLSKMECDLPSTLRHVRALALRHALSVERPDAYARLREIASISRSRSEAIHAFCHRVLYNELRNNLGLSFLLLLSDEEQTQAIVAGGTLPEGLHPAYKTVQALTHGKAGRARPFRFEARRLHKKPSEQTEVFERLDGAIFVPLSTSDEFLISVGLLPESSEEEGLNELAQILAEFFQPAILEHLLLIAMVWTDQFQAARTGVLTATSRFCMYVGQEQLAVLDAAQDLGEIPAPGKYVGRLRTLAEDLYEAGGLLKGLLRSTSPPTGSSAKQTLPPLEPLSMAALLDETWNQIKVFLNEGTGDCLKTTGDCRIFAQKEYLRAAIARILQWFLLRANDGLDQGPPHIFVHCGEERKLSFIRFEDRSQRLSTHLRQYIFEPFSETLPQESRHKLPVGPGRHLSLYLARVLIEFGNRGSLEDRTHEMEGECGHRLLMTFPRSSEPLANNV